MRRIGYQVAHSVKSCEENQNINETTNSLLVVLSIYKHCVFFYLLLQTTYENFRYRYDKKENPYNKGLPRNFRELFLSKIPPSLNNFREWVAEEDFIESVGGSSIPHLKAIMSSKEKGGDIEMGSKFTSDGQVPDILQSLDYTGIEDKLKGKNADGGIMFDPFFYPMSPNPKDIKQNFNAGNKAHAGERND